MADASKNIKVEDLSMSTLLLHADTLGQHADGVVGDGSVAPPISVTSTFARPESSSPQDADLPPGMHVYSRYSQPVRDRLETLLAAVHHAEHAVTYGSGLAAALGALLYFAPKRVAIRHAYFGCHQVIKLLQRHGPLQVIDIDDEFAPGDLLWLETPINPTGEIVELQPYADRIHAVGGKLIVDATFAPPPLQNPFQHGVDMVLHSATKFLGGHSDLLAGVLLTREKAVADQLLADRSVTGTPIGSLESWLLLRSLRTLELRVRQQSANAQALVDWLYQASGGKAFDGIPAGIIHSVQHASVQFLPGATPAWVNRQYPQGHTPIFSILLKTEEQARLLPHRMQLSSNATSLGSVESLMERRFDTDGISDPRLVRASIGLESIEDLKRDWRNALIQVHRETTAAATSAKL